MTAPLEPTGLSEARRTALRMADRYERLLKAHGYGPNGSLAYDTVYTCIVQLRLLPRLSDQEVPEGHTRIDGKLWRVEQYGRRWISNRLTGELYETDPDDASDDGDPLYRLAVPIPSTPEEACP